MVKKQMIGAIVGLALTLGFSVPAQAALSLVDANGNVLTQSTIDDDGLACQDIVFVGLRGSGEPATAGRAGMGLPVTAAFELWTSAMHDRHIAYLGVDYPALPVPNPMDLFTMALGVGGAWQEYLLGADQGINRTQAYLNARSLQCPREHYVLSGYSQGALVLHRMLVSVNAKARPLATDLFPRIDAVLAIADPDRLAGDDVGSLGTAPATPMDWGVGLLSGPVPNVYKPTTTLTSSISPNVSSRWYDVCDIGDLVCDTGRLLGVTLAAALVAGPGVLILTKGQVKKGTKVHETHYTASHLGMHTAAINAANSAMTAQPLVAIVSAARGVVGTPYAAPIVVTSGFDLIAASVTSGSLPPGLAISPVSGINGIPTTPGSWTFGYHVEDRGGQTWDGVATIRIEPAVIVNVFGDKLRLGQPGNLTIQAYSATGRAAGIRIAAGALPPGLEIVSNPFMPNGCEGTVGCVASGTPTVSGIFPFDYEIWLTDGTTVAGTTTVSVFGVPSPSVHVTAVSSRFVAHDPTGVPDHYELSISVSKVIEGGTTTASLADREDPASDHFSYASGDTNANAVIDVGEVWFYSATVVVWGQVSIPPSLTRTIVVTGNDDTGAPAYEESTYVCVLTP